MGKTILLCFIGLIANSLFAQDHAFPNTEVGGTTVQLIGQRNGTVLLWKAVDGKQFIDIYDTTDAHLLRSTEMIIPRDSDQLNIQKIVLVGTALKIVILRESKDNVKHAFLVYDFESAGVNAGSKIVVPIKNQGFKGRGYPVIESNQAHDCLLLGWESTDKKRSHWNIEMTMVDELSHVIQSREWTEGIASGEDKRISVAVNNRHQILLKVIREEMLKGVRKDSLIVRTFSTQDQQEPLVSAISLPVGMTCGQWFLSENDQYCRFFVTYVSYIGRYRKNGIAGICNIAVNADGSLGSVSYSEYSERTRFKTLYGVLEPEKNTVPEYYIITHTLFDDRGNSYLIQEKRVLTSVSYGFVSSSNGGLAHNWYYGALVVTKFAPDGAYLWDAYIPKSQFFLIYSDRCLEVPEREQWGMVLIPRDSERLISYVPFLENGELKLLFNDAPENCGLDQRKKRKYFENPQTGVPFVVSVSPDDGTFIYQCYEASVIAPYQFQYALCYGNRLFVPCADPHQNLLFKASY